jgi:hypothetical protein
MTQVIMASSIRNSATQKIQLWCTRFQRRLLFDGAVDVSQVIAKCVTGVGCSLLEVTGEVQLCAQRATGLDCFRLLPLPPPNFPGGCK